MLVAQGVFVAKGVLGLEGVVLALGRTFGYFFPSLFRFLFFAAFEGMLALLEGRFPS
jgi:hypothetical protein